MAEPLTSDLTHFFQSDGGHSGMAAARDDCRSRSRCGAGIRTGCLLQQREDRAIDADPTR